MEAAQFAQPVIQTPVWELSGWWRRVAAYIIDNLVIGLAMVVPLVLLWFAFGLDPEILWDDETSVPEDDTTLLVFVVLAVAVAIAIPIVYYCWMMSATNGQTLGKQALDIRVVREDGQDVKAGFAFVRQILVIGFLFGGLGGILYSLPQIVDFLWPLWDSKNQALHDKIVKSRVVMANQVVPNPDVVPPQPYFSPGQAPPPPPPPRPGQPYYGPLTPQGQPQPQFPQAPQPGGAAIPPPPPNAPPPPPPPGGASTPYTPPPGFENPVPEDKKD